MTADGGIGSYHYESFPLEVKRGWMVAGQGGEAAHSFGEALAQLSADFGASGYHIGHGFLQRRLPEWTGQAAHGATRALDAAATSVSSSGQSGQAGGGSVDQYGVSFTNTKNQIPEPPSRSFAGAASGPDAVGYAERGAAVAGPVGGAVGFGAGFAVDWVKQQLAYHQADQLANCVLRSHEVNTRTALAAFHTAIDPATGPVAGSPAAQGGSDSAGGRVIPPHSSGDAGSPPGAAAPGAHSGTGAGGAPGLGVRDGGGSAGVSSAGVGSAGVGSAGVGSGGTGSVGRHSGTPGGGAARAVPRMPSTTAPSNWTPGPTPPSIGGGRPDDLVRAPDGSFVPRANLPSLAPMRPMMSPSAKPSAGHGVGGRGVPPPRRTMGYPPSEARGDAGLGDRAGPVGGGAARSVPPMGSSGAGRGEQERKHRNNTFIPDDSPFRINDAELGVVPAVLDLTTIDELR